ncbi:MAG: tetratricopeptide repeat protein [Thermoleophilaceae bacterium]
MAVAPHAFDVDESAFEQRVVERSRELPVVVDFWAEWCGPCKALGPVLERAVAERAGKVELAKLDVDANQALAARFGIRGIPAVKAFRDGKVAAEFTGALPQPEVERFLDGLLPSEADELAARAAAEGDEPGLRRALELDPANAEARRALGRLLLRRGDHAEALQLLEPAAGDFLADGLAARAHLSGEEELRPAFEAWDRGDHAAALEQLQDALAGRDEPDRRDLIRRVLVGIFTELGADHPLAREHRRRLAAAWN